MSALTTIALKPETKERLKRHRLEKESYDELINRLLRETLPRRPPMLRELREMRDDEYVPLDEVLERLGL